MNLYLLCFLIFIQMGFFYSVCYVIFMMIESLILIIPKSILSNYCYRKGILLQEHFNKSVDHKHLKFNYVCRGH